MSVVDTAILAPAHGFAWLPLGKDQYEIARDLYDRYCVRFGLPRGGDPGGQFWMAITETDAEGQPRRIGGVLGVHFDRATAALEIAALYVFPTRLGVRAMESTVKRVAELYDQGHLRFVCCHVLVENRQMERLVAKHFTSRSGRIRAHLWTAGTVSHG